MGNPAGSQSVCCEGGFWQDALRKGAKIGVIAGSDDHHGKNGMVLEAGEYPYKYPGVTGVWAAENSPGAIFDALKAGRTFAYMLGLPGGDMHGRMEIDFRINGHYMGETIDRPDFHDLHIFYRIKSDVPIKSVTLVKNCRNYISLPYASEIILDYKQENPTDYYYLRVLLKDGRYGWTSPIWVNG